MAAESAITYNDGWNGEQVGYGHWIEVDFFEYDYLHNNASGTNYFGQALHDWYGVYGVTCPSGPYCNASPYVGSKRTTPAKTDFTQPHKYGFLWVPATPVTKGYVQSFFDDLPIGNTYQWDMFTGSPQQVPNPDGKPWEFGLMDSNHYFMILGTGLNIPMNIISANVWQSSASNNMYC